MWAKIQTAGIVSSLRFRRSFHEKCGGQDCPPHEFTLYAADTAVDGMGQTNKITDKDATERKVKRVRQSGSPEPDKMRMSLEEALTKSVVAGVLFL